MATKRDVIAEMLAAKSRSPYMHRARCIGALISLETLIRQIDAGQQLINYFPITMFTITEVFFRSAIAELIDHGPPYVERAGKLVKNNPFDLDAVLVLHAKKMTVGEFIGSQIKFNSLEKIIATMKTLLDSDYPAELTAVKCDLPLGLWMKVKEGDPVIDDVNRVSREFGRMIETRHIIVHELPDQPPFTAEDIPVFLDATRRFLWATDTVIWDIVEPNAPRTQGEMNERAAQQTQAADEELNEVVDQLKAVLDEERGNLLDQAQQVWEQQRRIDADLKALAYKGGSMMPMIYQGALRLAAERRKEHLLEILKLESDK